MELSILFKIKEDENLYKFLHEHSYYYKELNRNPAYYNEFLKIYKKYKRDNKIDNVNKTIENAEMITNLLKIVE